ncbi:MAG: hypothetical protein KDA78_15605 [Planctomycetaceae bacterium]|nr:hypothetical protein [Planctomycetaceae bacterium]
MNNSNQQYVIPARIQEEWHEILQAIQDMDQFWSEVDQLGRGPKWEELETRMCELRRLLVEHYQSEEQNLRQLEKTNRTALLQRIRQLREQNSEILQRLSADIALLSSQDRHLRCWGDVHSEINTLGERLKAYESTEQNIMVKSEE